MHVHVHVHGREGGLLVFSLKTQTQFALRGEKGEIHGRVVKVLLLLLVALAED